METPELTDFDRAEVLLNQAARALRKGKLMIGSRMVS